MRNLFLAMFVSVGFLACTDDSSNVIKGGGETEEAYFDLRLSFPETVSSSLRIGEPTTTDENGDGYQEGLGTEQRFQTVYVLLVDEGFKITSALTYSATDFAPDGNSAVDDDVINPTVTFREYASLEPKIVSKGDARVFVFLNPTTEISQKFFQGQVLDLSMLEMNPLTNSDLTTTIAADNNFLMSNEEMPEVITIDGTAANPTLFTVNVERTVAKLVENTQTTTFTLDNTLGAGTITASIDSYNYNYMNKRSFFVKQYEQRADAGAYSGLYVVDPNFVYTDYLAYSPQFPWYGNDFFILGYKDINVEFLAQPEISYCLENTMISNEQYVNKTTSIVYKASLSIDGAASATFYTYKNVIYTSYADLETVYNADYPAIPNALAQLFTENDLINAYQSNNTNFSTNVQALNQRLEARGIRAYYQGSCFYNWPIKHWEQDVLLGRMEFAVVRNNVYYLEVTNILSIGTPWVPGGPEDPDPSNPGPDESEDVYLSVDIIVLPWTVRHNNIEF